MRVVVTRPEPSAGRTADRLMNLGHQPILLPLTRALHRPEIAETALKKPHAALALTSAEAARVLSSVDCLSPYLDEVLYAVGEATARAAEEAGFRKILKGPGTGSELARLVLADAPIFDAPLLYLAGRPRSASFEEGLRAAKMPLAVAEIYEMIPIAYDENTMNRILEHPVDAVLLYSRENARLFFELMAPFADALSNAQIICLSDNVAAAVPPEFHRKIKIAAHADENGLLALL
jgi:uroporphyrinogen-III synthase